jgi:hypothetical protein
MKYVDLGTISGKKYEKNAQGALFESQKIIF